MATDYELISYRPGLKTQVIELQVHLWSPDLALNTAYFEWKYERNPYLKEPLVYLMMRDGKAIGMRGFHGVQWEAGTPTQRFTELYADDMVIAPEHRKRGHASTIMAFAFEELAKQKYDFVFNLSAGPQTLRTSLSMGWRSAGWMRPMRWRRWQTALESGANRVLGRLPAVSRKLGDLGLKRHHQSLRSLTQADYLRRAEKISGAPAAISVAAEPRCEAMADLVERIETGGAIRPVRSSEFFAWRFQNPLSRYQFIFWDEDRLEGYLVLQEYTSENTSLGMLNIVDWEACNAAIRARLLQCAIAIARDKRLIIWSATMQPATIALLEREGFESLAPPTDTGPPALLMRPIRPERLNDIWMLGGMPMLDLASWDLPMLCSMAA